VLPPNGQYHDAPADAQSDQTANNVTTFFICRYVLQTSSFALYYIKKTARRAMARRQRRTANAVKAHSASRQRGEGIFVALAVADADVTCA
jgi:hypothetical protein